MKGYEFGFNLDKNVSTKERIVSIISGGTLVIRGITGKKNIRQIVSGGLLLFRGITGHCHIYNLFLKEKELTDNGKLLLKTSVIIDRPKADVFKFWSSLDNLPRFMTHLVSVNIIDDNHSEWKMKVLDSLGTIDWTSKINTIKTNELISWESLPGSEIENSGEVKFEAFDKTKTKLDISIAYKAPEGNIGKLASLLFMPIMKRIITSDIQNCKSYLENPELNYVFKSMK